MAIEGFRDLDFDAYHRDELSAALAGGRDVLAAEALRRVGQLGSLALRLEDGPAWTYLPGAGRVMLQPGEADAETVIELPLEAWEGLVHDYESAPGLLYGGRVRCPRGKAMRFVGWEPALRALYSGRPVCDPEAPLVDDGGQRLDPEQTFRLDEDPVAMARFLRAAGYLIVRGVFPPDEIEALLADARSLRGEARRGDKLSWWARGADGEEILCRVTRAGARASLRALTSDARLRRLASLADDELVSRARPDDDEGVSVIYKHPGASEGLSDLPWHRDCGMGGHATMCPLLIASVYLTEATPETGELAFLPGSHRGSWPYMDARSEKAPRGAHFAARPGDVSLHYGDVMHAAPPPTRADLTQYRVSAVTAFVRPSARNHRGARTYNDVLHQREDGQVEHLSVVAGRA